MLRTVAELIQRLKKEEQVKLDNFNIKHRPTIGKMYEGLTSEILTRTIPSEIDLSVQSGVIYNDLGEMTGEIDCMLVEGKGIRIPYTNNFKWHIKDVICVVEVKKTLYGKDLADSFLHMRSVLSNYSRYIQSEYAKDTVNFGRIRRVFSKITNTVAPNHKKVNSLPLMEEMVYHMLVLEQLAPIRIILGYHGYKSEHSFRKAMLRFIEENLNKQGFGVGSFPQLIISKNYSLLKINGQPYTLPLRNGYWDFYVSSSEDPTIFILELIWTRLQRKYNLQGLWGDDLQKERLNGFLSARAVKKNEKTSWEYEYTPINQDSLKRKAQSEKWAPAFLDLNQFIIINYICKEGSEDITDADFIEWVERKGLNISDFVDSLLKTGLVARSDNLLKLTTEKCECATLPTGEYVAAENNTGRLTRWLAEKGWNIPRSSDAT